MAEFYMTDDSMTHAVKESDKEGYEQGFNAGWDACHERFRAILKRFHQYAILSRLPLHPVQPDEVLEHRDWLMAQGKNPDKEGS